MLNVRVWGSLVTRLIWDQEIGGSNPLTRTNPFVMGNGKIRNKLWKEDPHCHWCRCLTIPPPPGKNLGRQADDTATLDHLYSKWELRDNPDLKLAQKTFLACAKCNAERGRKAERAWLTKYRAETATICNPPLVKLGEILGPALGINSDSLLTTGESVG